MLYNKIFKKYPSSSAIEYNTLPTETITLLIAAYNEEEYIQEKIENCKRLNYPKDLLKIAFVTDGSTDRTPEIISAYHDIRLFHHPERQGKAMAINRAMREIETSLVIFCDVNTELNDDALLHITKHFRDEKVGAVAGEKRINPKYLSNTGRGEGLYWKYESFLKQVDSDFYSVVGAAGELFAIRRALYQPIKPDTILDDFVISLRINQAGYRVIYEPNAFALENPSATMKEEKKRKVRICAGAFQSIFRLLPLLNFFKYGKLSFLYISHRVLRWLVTPFSLSVLLIVNMSICIYFPTTFYNTIFIAQILFYSLAGIGWLCSKFNHKVPLVNTFYYFTFMNYNVYLGLLEFLSGKQYAIWQKSVRAKPVLTNNVFVLPNEEPFDFDLVQETIPSLIKSYAIEPMPDYTQMQTIANN